MKDYLTYQLMKEFGVAAPLSSYVYITVNGEDWGLYLAAEGVEDAFLQRNYGRNHGELYKPDSMGFGGGRGNGRDFDMNDFMNRGDEGQDSGPPNNMQPPEQPKDMPEGFDPGSFGGQVPDIGGDGNALREDAHSLGQFDGQLPGQEDGALPQDFDASNRFGNKGRGK